MELVNMPTPTGWMIMFTGLVWFFWELYVLIFKRQTISSAMRRFATQNPAVPFLLGFLFGHFYW